MLPGNLQETSKLSIDVEKLANISNVENLLHIIVNSGKLEFLLGTTQTRHPPRCLKNSGKHLHAVGNFT